MNAVRYAEDEMMMVENARAIVEAYDADADATGDQTAEEEAKDAE